MSDSLLGLCGSLIQKLAKKPALANGHEKALEKLVTGLEGLRAKGKEAIDLYQEIQPELAQLKAKLKKMPKQKRTLGQTKKG